MRGRTLLVACAIAAAVSRAAAAQERPPALAAIREADLRADLALLAGDGMRGREAGTLDELRAAAWLAQRAAAAGLEPAGDDGTYYQFFPLHRAVVSPASTFALDGHAMPYLDGLFVVRPADADVRGTIRFIGAQPAESVAAGAHTGAVLVADLVPPPDLPDPAVSLWAYRYTFLAIQARGGGLAPSGAAAVILVCDSVAESQLEFLGRRSLARGLYGLEPPPLANTVVLLASRRHRERLRAAEGRSFTARVRTDRFAYPSANVVARVRGRDPTLRHEHVLFSGHHDHDGVILPVDGDSVWNGADDNASVAVAMLAVGRAFARAPGRRSALFVWHGAEEKGLFGSRWFAERPTVPLESIVAVLNADMIGRNPPGQAALLGAQPPHRNSLDLARWALEANAQVARLAVDTLWDRPEHPEFWYFRSDHLPYARRNVPALFFSSLPHEDYHTPRDAPGRIDHAKLAQMTRWIYATGWRVASALARPRLVEGFRLER